MYSVCVILALLVSVVLPVSAVQLTWSYPTNQQCTGPAVYEYLDVNSVEVGIVIFGCDDSHVRALNAFNGSLIWKTSLSGSAVTDPSITLDGTVYIATSNGAAYALDARTGNQIWSYTSQNGIEQRKPMSYCGGLVYFAVTNGNVHALNATTGASVWKDRTSYYPNPNPTCIDGMVVFSMKGYLRADDIKTMATLWTFGSTNVPGTHGFSPAFGLGEHIFASNHGKVYVVDAATGNFKRKFEGATNVAMVVSRGKIVMTTAEGSLLAYDAFGYTKAWNTTDQQFLSAPIASETTPVEDVVYVGGALGVYAVSSTNGTTLKTFATNTPVTRPPVQQRQGYQFVFFATQQAVSAVTFKW